MPDCCGSDLYCRSAYSECRSTILHCRNVVAPETSLSEWNTGTCLCTTGASFHNAEVLRLRPALLERCGSDLHCRSTQSECRSACLYCRSACKNKREKAI
ncbi:hypothetical protein AMTR_s00033p00144110 [Amborella trichopoda]|uniref:Uncharacterized protein n=1 Tax=Amborella trichopoda TaxID=13333 RepID=U5CYM4_AMBTC|nr:hypothetical protein AMTR_s00033p00144110 [Amborella trichopoda]